MHMAIAQGTGSCSLLANSAAILGDSVLLVSSSGGGYLGILGARSPDQEDGPDHSVDPDYFSPFSCVYCSKTLHQGV